MNIFEKMLLLEKVLLPTCKGSFDFLSKSESLDL